MNGRLSKKTLFIVAGIHVIVLLGAVIFSRRAAPPPPAALTMVSLGLEDNLNPAAGEPSAQQRGPEGAAPAPTPTPPTPAPEPTPPAPPPPTPTPPKPTITEKTPDKPVTPPPPVTPPKPTPARAPVKPNLDTTIRAPGTAPNTTKPVQRPGAGAGTVERDLTKALGTGGNPRAGVSGGTGTDGSPGTPTGNPHGDWYRTAIKNHLERHWIKPQAGNPNLSATVKIRILADGTIQYVGMTAASGDNEMDNSVVAAILAAKKMPSPPPTGFPVPYEDTVIFRLRGGE